MLSYEHAYHAGNHADVLKHAVLTAVIRALQRKSKPLRVLDGHAGSGVYDLLAAPAQWGREFETGVARIFAATDPPESLRPYLDLLSALNPEGRLVHYPGSPELARALLRPTDELELFELHPRAWAELRARYAQQKRIHIHRRDAYEGLVAVVPPKERRGVVLIDPSYEVRDEARRVVETVAGVHDRWANAVSVVWYPALARGEPGVVDGLARLGLARAYRVELVPAPQARGLRGSGLVIVNPPFELEHTLGVLLPWLGSKLGSDARSGWSAAWL